MFKWNLRCFSLLLLVLMLGWGHVAVSAGVGLILPVTSVECRLRAFPRTRAHFHSVPRSASASARPWLT